MATERRGKAGQGQGATEATSSCDAQRCRPTREPGDHGGLATGQVAPLIKPITGCRASTPAHTTGRHDSPSERAREGSRRTRLLMTTPCQATATPMHEGEAVAVAVASPTLSGHRTRQEVPMQPCAPGLPPRTNNLPVSALFVEKMHLRAQSVYLTTASETSLYISASPPRRPNLCRYARTLSCATTPLA